MLKLLSWPALQKYDLRVKSYMEAISRHKYKAITAVTYHLWIQLMMLEHMLHIQKILLKLHHHDEF